MNSSIYTGHVRHRRFAPAENSFTYSVAMFCLDLAEVPSLFRSPGLLGYDRPALFAFHRKDYFGDPARPLDECVRDRVQAETGRRPQGPIRLLTQLRYFGYCFNPVSFYYCYGSDGKSVEFILAEITNTPWNERHAYVLERGGGERLEFSFDKEFHVSPFMSMDQKYRWLFSPPTEALNVHMDNFERGGRLFDATLTLKRSSWNAANLAYALLLHPFMTFKTVASIHFQALKLWLKKVPFHPHPGYVKAKGEVS